jgi:hypothetical protein
MNRLSIADRAKILGMLVEENSLRSCARMAEVSLNTVTKLLVDLGGACEKFHDQHVRNVRVRRLQCDEIWCFVGAQAKNVTPEQKAQGWGDTWTWTGLCADTKLCVGYLVGGRDADWAMEFMLDCAARIKGRVQVTTDGHKAYLEAVETAFGADCDYAMLQKIYGAPSDEESRHYPTARCIGCDLKVVSGETDPKHASTSHVERLNLTMGMSVRRRTRLTNAFSKKIQNHAAMVAIHAVHYNFARIHKTLRITPAMAAGLSDHVWRLEEIVMMADCCAPKPSKRGPYKKRNAD